MKSKTVVIFCVVITICILISAKFIFPEFSEKSDDVNPDERTDVIDENSDYPEKFDNDNPNDLSDNQSVDNTLPIEKDEFDIQTDDNQEISENASVEETETTISDNQVTNRNQYVDFDYWQSRNPDVYAWIYVPDANISYPIVQRNGDDGYYLRRDIDGKNATAGTLFTEGSYNKKDFSDPVTIVYGHSMRDGTMFGTLETFGKSLSFDDTNMIYIYTPENVFTYTVVAAVPYTNMHILYYNDFSNEIMFDDFFNNLFASRSLIANIDWDNIPKFGDKVIILSTCLKSDSKQRYLLVGKLIK